MKRLVLEAKKSLPIRQAAISLTNRLNQKDQAAEIKAIHSFVRDDIRFVKDIRNVETLIRPQELLKIGSGDCDDKSMLLAALLESIGFETRFLAIGRKPNRYRHVLVEVKYHGKWIPLETTENVQAGWYPPGKWYRLEVEI